MIDKNKYTEKLSSQMQCQMNKPLELYLFIDPLCLDSWELEPIIKKLQIEYGHYFTLTYVLSARLSRLNQLTRTHKLNQSILKSIEKTVPRNSINCDDQDSKIDHTQTSPFLTSVAIKAAELQGRRAGVRFLKKLHEYLFIKNKNITELDTLISCAKDADLDVNEFSKDIHSPSTSNAFQCDLKISNEMEVTEFPTLVFFNHKADEEGIKLPGVYPYEIYIEIMAEILGEHPVNHPLPSLLSFIKHHQFVTTKEIACLYNWPNFRVEIEMKKLMLRNEVEKLKSRFGTYWYYVGNQDQ